MDSIKIFWTFLFSCFSVHLAAQQGEIFHTGNSDLPFNTVRCVELQGNMKWIGTDFGLAMYDDSTWTNYNAANSGLPDNRVRSIMVTSSGDLLIGTFDGGLARFDGASWEIWNTGNSSLPDNFVKCTAEDSSGNFWIGTMGGLVYLSDDSMSVFNMSNSILHSDNISSLAIDAGGTIWVGTIYGGLVEISGKIWENYRTDNTIVPINLITDLKIDSSGNVWMATPIAGIIAYADNWFYRFSLANSNIASNSLTGLQFDRSGAVYTTSDDEGLIKYTGASNWFNYNEINSIIPDDFLLDVQTDTFGNKWVGTMNSGLVRFNEDETNVSVATIQKSDPPYSFRNPVNDKLRIRFNEDLPTLVQINSLNGETLLQEKSVTKNYVVDLPSSGLYVIMIYYEHQRFTEKILSIH